MKKELLTILGLCVFTSAFSQLNVNPNGNVSIQSNATPLSPLSICGAGRSDYKVGVYGNKSCYYAETSGATESWGHGGKFVNHLSGSSFLVGARADVYPLDEVNRNYGRSFGLIGIAGYATSGWNYSVYGRLDGGNNGAAIYGTTNSSENGTYVDGKYAGYFNGNTKVIGNLNVTGSIYGVVLGKSASVSSASKVTAFSTTDDLSLNKLNKLSAYSFYKDHDSEVAKLRAVNMGDTIVEERKLTSLEVQDLYKQHYALSAEQVEEVYPDLVYENEDGTKSINYMEMVPLLVKSINELSAKIAELEGKNGNASFSKYNNTTGLSNISDSDVAVLSQNAPNPFSDTSSIVVNIPPIARNASLYMYNMAGSQIKQIEIADRGECRIQLVAGEFGAGMYLYSLVVDNKVIDTKRMLITQ